MGDFRAASTDAISDAKTFLKVFILNIYLVVSRDPRVIEVLAFKKLSLAGRWRWR